MKSDVSRDWLHTTGFTAGIDTMMKLAMRRLGVGGACVYLAMAAGGCALAGLIGRALPGPTIAPKYTNLKKQTVAVMVWTDRGVAIEQPNLQYELAAMIQQKLLDAQQKDKPKELEGMKFPWSAESVLRFQRDHPDTEEQAIADVAPRLGVSRLIYIEVEYFQTRPSDSLELFRGSISATLKVLEIRDGKATVAYEESNIRDVYPPKSPEEGVPNKGELWAYEGTVDEFTTDVAHRFVPYQQEE